MKYGILVFANMVCGFVMMYFYGKECSQNTEAYKKLFDLDLMLATIYFLSAGICLEKLWS